MSRLAWWLIAVSVGFGCGCSERAAKSSGVPQTETAASPPVKLIDVGGMADPGVAQPAGAKQAGPNAPPAGDVAKAQPVERKIIYTAKLDLVVKNLDESAKAVEDKLAAHAGRLVRSEMRSDSGARRIATFTLEVPVDKFRGLVAALKEVGAPERDGVDSQDVTEEFVDLEARLRNLRVEEETLNRLLKEKAGNVPETLAIRAQIVPVREGIERAEGRMKYLSTRAAFSTVTLTLREVADYKPPTAPTFTDRIARTFGGSWDALLAFGEGVVLFVVAVGVWLPLLIPAGFAGLWGLRRVVRAVNEATAPPPTVRPRRSRDTLPVVEIDPSQTLPEE